MNAIRIFICAVSMMLAVAMPAAAEWVTISNGRMWKDTDGNDVQAHGAGFLKVGDTWYMIGEDRSDRWHPDVNMYSSTDLKTWKFERKIIENGVTHPDLGDARMIERPKLLYCEKTGQFVVWCHWESRNYGASEAGVFVSDTINGPYRFHWGGRPLGVKSRDCNVFVDDDGTAYFISTIEENQHLGLFKLSDDYLSAVEYTELFKWQSREAPAIVKVDDTYYMLSSACTGWEPNPCKLTSSKSLTEGWSELKQIGNHNAFDTQPASILSIKGSEDTTYLYVGDRWMDPGLPESKTIIFPIDFANGDCRFEYLDSFDLDMEKGIWRHTQNPDAGTFDTQSGTFMLNGEPFIVMAAELHYPRIPREYWVHRIKLCKALGMNTICLYTFWNAHEPRMDEFDFTGQNDIREFIKLCDQNDMKVILRPGPYVCAEWEMGGLPWWLLKKKDIKLRHRDKFFMERVDKFQQALAEQVGDLTIGNGGPIIMLQVENEYGSYATDKAYVAAVRDLLRKNFGSKVTLFQCDWASNFLNNGLDDLLWTINFGTGANIDQQFAELKKHRPDSPLMCSEFWSGWFDKWGANHETRPAADMIAGIDEMLSKGISFSLYMTHGGTNWGHWAGANSPGYAPDVTSYDYDAPISESGQTTPKYWQLRETLAKYMNGEKQSKVPAPIKTMTVPAFDFTEFAPLFGNLPEPKFSADIKTMEEFDQGFGSIMYRTVLPEIPFASTLTVNEPHDFAQIFVDGKLIGILDRRNGEKELTLPPVRKGAVIDILVEAMGRINFGRAIKDFKGITDNVIITLTRDGHSWVTELKDWEVFNIEDAYETYAAMQFGPMPEPEAGRMPRGVYRATFNIKGKPTDTFLNFETWGKGLVYVNGYPMGRIWEIGPQQTLYMPGCWLRKGKNEILVFDILGPREARCEGLKEPKLDQLLMPKRQVLHSGDVALDFADSEPAAVGEFSPGNGWQEVKLGKSVTGRYLAVEALDAHDGKGAAAIAELYLLDDKGQRLSREPWTAVYADSEDAGAANRTADKVFDLQESTYWQSAPDTSFPHVIIIDLGATRTVSALQYLPRMEAEAPGAIRAFRLYVMPTLPLAEE